MEYRLDRRNSTIFELVPDSDEAVTASMTQNIMNCGFTPTFDRCVVVVVVVDGCRWWLMFVYRFSSSFDVSVVLLPRLDRRRD